MHNRRACVPGKMLRNLTCSDNKDNDINAKRPKLTESTDDSNMIGSNIAFFRAHYTDKNLPKMKLHVYAMKNHFDQPSYKTQQEDKLFRSILTFDGRQFASSYWEKNKRFAEQGAALVCLLHLGLIDEQILIKNGSILK